MLCCNISLCCNIYFSYIVAHPQRLLNAVVSIRHDLYQLCFIVLCVETIFVLHIVKHPWGRDVAVVVGP